MLILSLSISNLLWTSCHWRSHQSRNPYVSTICNKTSYSQEIFGWKCEKRTLGPGFWNDSPPGNTYSENMQIHTTVNNTVPTWNFDSARTLTPITNGSFCYEDEFCMKINYKSSHTSSTKLAITHAVKGANLWGYIRRIWHTHNLHCNRFYKRNYSYHCYC